MSPDHVWKRGGPPVALAGEDLFLVNEGSVYRLRRDQVTEIGQTRASDYRMMQVGTLVYLIAIPIALLGGVSFAALVGIALAILGGVLVTKGFLSRALLIQVDDDAIPPFVIDHRKWKGIRAHIEHWA